MPFRFDCMTATEIAALDPTKTIVFLPLGGLEDHGPHLPMNADVIEAEALAARLAEKAESETEGYRGLIYPSVPLAWDLTTSKFSIRVRGHVLRDYLMDTCSSLHRMGLRHFVCVSGSYAPAHLTAIEEAGIWLRRKHGRFRKRITAPILVSASSVSIDERAKSESSWWMNPTEHGGARDTSVVLAITPEAVRSNYASLPPYFRPDSGLMRWWLKRQNKVESYWGSPSEGTQAAGGRLLDERVSEIYPKLKAVWTGANPQVTFKSWYSVFPSNRTLFPIWLLFIGLVILGAVWVGALLQAVTEGAGLGSR